MTWVFFLRVRQEPIPDGALRWRHGCGRVMGVGEGRDIGVMGRGWMWVYGMVKRRGDGRAPGGLCCLSRMMDGPSFPNDIPSLSRFDAPLPGRTWYTSLVWSSILHLLLLSFQSSFPFISLVSFCRHLFPFPCFDFILSSFFHLLSLTLVWSIIFFSFLTSRWFNLFLSFSHFPFSFSHFGLISCYLPLSIFLHSLWFHLLLSSAFLPNRFNILSLSVFLSCLLYAGFSSSQFAFFSLSASFNTFVLKNRLFPSPSPASFSPIP